MCEPAKPSLILTWSEKNGARCEYDIVAFQCIFLPQFLWHNPNGLMAVQIVDRHAWRSRIFAKHFICTINTEFSQNFHSQLKHGARRYDFTHPTSSAPFYFWIDEIELIWLCEWDFWLRKVSQLEITYLCYVTFEFVLTFPTSKNIWRLLPSGHAITGNLTSICLQ